MRKIILLGALSLVMLISMACNDNKEQTFFEDTGKKMDQGIQKSENKLDKGLNKAGEKIQAGFNKAGEKVKEVTD